MLEEYLYIIIALIFALTLLIIYLLTLKFKKDEQDVLESIRQNERKIVQSIDVKNTEKNDSYILTGHEEGSFNNNSFQDEPKQTTRKKEYRKKVEVPPHDKIVKDNFKEFAGTKILVAEDNVINQKVIQGLLSDSGIEITMADDGKIALEILEQNSDFNFILMDAHMPRVDGYQATRMIRSNPNYEHIVIVALSGDIATDDVKKMKNAGMEEHLEKPLRMDHLYDILYAYTHAMEKKEEPVEEALEVETIKQLNEEQGLLVCGGDVMFYKDILNEFIHDYENSTQELTTYLNNDNVHAADSLLLDFIGVTANIGANNINKIALELKEAIKDSEIYYYDTLLEKYTKSLEMLLNDIREYIK